MAKRGNYERFTGPKMVMKNRKQYEMLRGKIGKRWILWEGFASKCPFCSKLIFQKGLVKKRRKPGLFKHLKYCCKKVHWYWEVYHYKLLNKYNMEKYNWHIYNSERRIIKKYIGGYRNLREFAKSLDK